MCKYSETLPSFDAGVSNKLVAFSYVQTRVEIGRKKNTHIYKVQYVYKSFNRVVAVAKKKPLEGVVFYSKIVNNWCSTYVVLCECFN